MKITCNYCKEEVDVAFYFSDALITTEMSFYEGYTYYRAQARGRTICPACGKTIDKIFTEDITKTDIIKLAIGGRINEKTLFDNIDPKK